MIADLPWTDSERAVSFLEFLLVSILTLLFSVQIVL